MNPIYQDTRTPCRSAEFINPLTMKTSHARWTLSGMNPTQQEHPWDQRQESEARTSLTRRARQSWSKRSRNLSTIGIKNNRKIASRFDHHSPEANHNQVRRPQDVLVPGSDNFQHQGVIWSLQRMWKQPSGHINTCMRIACTHSQHEYKVMPWVDPLPTRLEVFIW